MNLHDEGPTPGWDDPAVLAGPHSRFRPGRFAVAVTDSAARPRLRPRPLAQLKACRHHSKKPLRLADPRPQRARDRDPEFRRTRDRPRQCSPHRHCPRAVQSRRHSSVTPVPTASRSHGRAPLSRLRSSLLPPHSLPRHVYPRLCQRN